MIIFLTLLIGLSYLHIRMFLEEIRKTSKFYGSINWNRPSPRSPYNNL